MSYSRTFFYAPWSGRGIPFLKGFGCGKNTREVVKANREAEKVAVPWK
jgi:hypothetical protein